MITIPRDEVPSTIHKLREDDPDWRYVAKRVYNPSTCAHPNGPCTCRFAILITDEDGETLGFV